MIDPAKATPIDPAKPPVFNRHLWLWVPAYQLWLHSHQMIYGATHWLPDGSVQPVGAPPAVKPPVPTVDTKNVTPSVVTPVPAPSDCI